MTRPKQTIEEKADAYLAAGKVNITFADAEKVEALVHGSEDYAVRFVGVWTCDCPARVDRCAHVVAVSKVAPRSKSEVHMAEHDEEIDFLLGLSS